MNKNDLRTIYSFGALSTTGILVNMLLAFFGHILLNLHEDANDVFDFDWITSFKLIGAIHLIPLTTFLGAYLVYTYFKRMVGEVTRSTTHSTQEYTWYKVWAVGSGGYSALAILGTLALMIFSK